MPSSVFYKFKNSKEPELIFFEGTSISVFELKREIITASGLGDGTDFNLHIYPEHDMNSEYKDDTTLIPRSDTVIAVRRPAPRGRGRAARYVTGRAPVRAITKETKPAPSAPGGGADLTETDAEAAFLAESASVWDAQKEALSHAKPVFHKKKAVVVPNHDPPPGYVCRRCNIKGHWIQACPTNDDPDFKPVFQAKRTTGIPQSFLKKVEKPIDEEAAKGVMLNADGEYVQVMADTKTWEKFQEKVNATKAQAASADAASEEVRQRGLECSIDKRMFVDPVKTPCCSKTYCRECIDNALADGDLICPNCAQEDVLMDDLVADEDMVKSIKAYEAEKAKEKFDKEEEAKAEAQAAVVEPASSTNNEHEISASNTAIDMSTLSATGAAKATSSASPAPGGNGNGSDTESTTSRKRKSPPTEIKPPSAPKAMRQQKEQEARQASNPTAQMEQEFIQQMEVLKNAPANMPMPMPMPMPMMGMPTMPGMPNMSNGGNMNGSMGFQPPFNSNMGFNNGGAMMNAQMMGMPMHMQQMQMQNPMMNGIPNFGMMNQQQQQHQGQSQWNGGGQHGGFNGGYGNGGMNGMNGMNGYGQGQQGDYNDAYDRQPVNPRHRNRKSRAPDFRYL
ncbi:DWNN-domain-containing protein [Plenodomus tracheiphilus IPT5]|uniref:DWNN-domain-containing protein n=1 Tax=Plenodomus tracheiphilus IPT5 TaxID=1408161 RepID=A0A6A7APR4_9PLEO|nr:DWNN-domain-containing protein [Plenodomus tracheiphilus IPT5]